jgi:predicted nucleotidyltransferase
MNVDFVNDPDLLVLSGSHLYGYSTPESDEDHLGFVRPPIERDIGMIHRFEQKTPTEAELAEGKDRKVYSLRKFLEHLSRNDTQCLEILFAPPSHIVEITEIGQIVMDARDIFVSKHLFRRFAGYAYSEYRKVRGVALEPVKQTPTEQQVIDQIRNLFRPDKKRMDDIIDLLYADRERKEVSVFRKLGAARKESIEKYGYSVKNAAHCLRLLMEGVDILTTGELHFPMPVDRVELLRRIRAGDPDFKEIEELYHHWDAELKKAADNSPLPQTVDMDNVNDLFLELTLGTW